MKIWIHLDGVQEGPFEPGQLPLDRMTAETPVWHEGLADWMTAAEAPGTAHLFGAARQPEAQASRPVSAADSQPWRRAAARQPQAAAAEAAMQGAAATATAQGPASTYLLPVIIISVLTLNPIGIIPLIMGIGVRKRNRRQKYAAAHNLSHNTAWWVMILIVTSLMLPFTLLI